jgi:hypothetical protein
MKGASVRLTEKNTRATHLVHRRLIKAEAVVFVVLLAAAARSWLPRRGLVVAADMIYDLVPLALGDLG